MIHVWFIMVHPLVTALAEAPLCSRKCGPCWAVTCRRVVWRRHGLTASRVGAWDMLDLAWLMCFGSRKSIRHDEESPAKACITMYYAGSSTVVFGYHLSRLGAFVVPLSSKECIPCLMPTDGMSGIRISSSTPGNVYRQRRCSQQSNPFPAKLNHLIGNLCISGGGAGRGLTLGGKKWTVQLSNPRPLLELLLPHKWNAFFCSVQIIPVPTHLQWSKITSMSDNRRSTWVKAEVSLSSITINLWLHELLMCNHVEWPLWR